jgi:hypothetical protein
MPFRIPSSLLILAPFAIIILGAVVYLNMAPGLPPSAVAASFAPAAAQDSSVSQAPAPGSASGAGRQRPASPVSSSSRPAALKRRNPPSSRLTASTAATVHAFPGSDGTAFATTQAGEDDSTSTAAPETNSQRDRPARDDRQSASPQFLRFADQAGEAAQAAPPAADLPLAFQNIDPKASGLTDNQVKALDGLREDFVSAVKRLPKDPQDPDYLDGWNDAARIADLKLRATMGTVFADQVALQAIRNKTASNGGK